MIFSMVGLLRIPLHRQKNIFTGCDIIIMPYHIQMNERPLKHDSFHFFINSDKHDLHLQVEYFFSSINSLNRDD